MCPRVVVVKELTMEDQDWRLTSGVHAGKAIRELSDRELRCVWAGINGGKSKKKEHVFRVLSRELHRREGTICPPWAIDRGQQREPQTAVELANWLRDNAADLCIEYDVAWAISSSAFKGWANDRDFETALRKAKELVVGSKSPSLAACA